MRSEEASNFDFDKVIRHPLAERRSRLCHFFCITLDRPISVSFYSEETVASNISSISSSAALFDSQATSLSWELAD